MKYRTEIIAILLVLGAIGAFVGLRSTRPADPVPEAIPAQSEKPVDMAAPQRVANELNKAFPQPYVDGLVMEHAQVVDDRLVIDIRIPDTSLASLDPAKIPVIRKQEQGDLVIAACQDATLRSVLDAGAKVARRFLDQDRKLIFEIVASKADCAQGGTP